MFLLLALACAHTTVVAQPMVAPSASVMAESRQRTYVEAPTGSAEALVNAAIAAERVGDLPEALALAREAYVASPDRRRHRYVVALEGRVDALGGVAALP
jgi:hypothetical protein